MESSDNLLVCIILCQGLVISWNGLYICLGRMMIRRWVVIGRVGRILVGGILSRPLVDVSKVGIVLAYIVEICGIGDVFFCIVKEGI